MSNSPARPIILRTAILGLIASLTLTGCSRGIDNSRLSVDIIEDKAAGFAISRLPLDPASAYLRAATAQGLVAFDAQGKVIPAMASRWIVTDDGLSYIFRLDKIRWNDGRQVTAKQVADILNSRITELRQSAFGDELIGIDRAVSMTGKVVEIRLKAPMPNLLELLAQPQFGIVFKSTGSGPMIATKSGRAMQLRLKGIDERGNPVLENDRITLQANRASVALTRFKAGQIDLVDGGHFQHLPELTAAKISDGVVQSDPVPGLFGLLFVEAGPFLSVRSNREAIAMAIDRPKLLTSFENFAWKENILLMPDTLQNRASVAPPTWAPLSVDQRQTLARDAIARWKTANGNVRPLRIALPAGPGGKILFARIRRDFVAIGLDARRVSFGDNADLVLVDRVAQMSSPSWYLAQMSCEITSVCNAEADALVEAARMARTAEERQRLLGEAETKLQESRNFIPLANPMRWSLTRDGLLGHSPNPRGLHLLQYLGRPPT
ncbi:ABC transporter substrate-binding protein [Sphingorhabdus arenilitoris]|uniref:ABC transporter substrate-binding protein n=1 Tax=Sphingorhabdus arenilitoris TaxID=1490041 RepID=A0ABV8RHU5_9SPHN